MTELNINDNNVYYLDNCDYLSITRLTIYAPNNINLVLDKLHKFTNLQELYLGSMIERYSLFNFLLYIKMNIIKHIF